MRRGVRVVLQGRRSACTCAFDERVRRIDGGLARSVPGYDNIGGKSGSCVEHPAWPGDFPRELVRAAGFDIGDVSDTEFRNSMFEAVEVVPSTSFCFPLPFIRAFLFALTGEPIKNTHWTEGWRTVGGCWGWG